ncbi:hypothetical protein E1212_27320 [Jiangella ureilytica]|uniref:Uncharacterized protein n=1 Tax=Jiangella ureilytica TaxID=2530374 RepID=A0A4R4RCZ0_9ACTN|nr:hypothetical protein [Jiangella ureilytica]TDC46232.1 hypothetical protein E1212_27320 [Jiangella ureilytica]
MTGDFDDDLTRRLSGLSADLDGVSLAGPSAARARAARRTRHQVTGGVLAGVAAVAAGVAIISPPDLTTTPDPAPPASLSTPATTDPTTTTAVALSAALLTPGDLAPVDAPWTESRDRTDVVCDPAPVLASLSSTVDRAAVTYAASDGNAVRQDLVRFGAATSADELWTEMRSCLPAQGEGDAPVVTDEYRLSGVGDEGWLIRYYTDPAAEDSDAVTAALVRYQDVVSLTVRTQPRADTVGAELDTDLPVTAARRMCETVFGESCVTEPALEDVTGAEPIDDPTDAPAGGPTGDPAEPTEPTEPADEPATELLGLADDPFLTDDDVAAVGAAAGFFRSPQSTETAAHQAPCLQDLTAAGATTVSSLGYIHDLDASLAEWVLLMPDADTAFRLVSAHTVLPDVCGEVGDDREQTVGEAVAVDVDGADDAVAWTVESVPTAENGGSSTSFSGIGIARVGNIAVVVSFAAMDDPSGGDWPGVVTPLLATALERAVG